MRNFSISIGFLIISGAMGQDKVCTVPPTLYEILSVESITKHGPEMTGAAVLLSTSDIDSAECILDRFITWHNGLSRTQRDSLMDASGNRLRPECITKDWSRYFRQYAGERSADGLSVHINLMHQNLTEISKPMMNAKGSYWTLVSDGGNGFFTATVHLGLEQVIQYQVNGPYPPDGWCR